LRKNELTLIDKKIFWVFIFQIFKILNGLIPIVLIPLYLSLHEQGIWFLMLSFGAIILLFSASQNSIALIFGSHEFRNLKINKLSIIGMQNDINTLFSFLKFSNEFFLKFLTSLSVLVFFSFFFYIDEIDSFNLSIIFMVYILGLFIYGVNFSILSYIESFNQVEYAYKYKSILIITIMILTIIFLYYDYKLYALSLSVFLSMFFWCVYFLYKFKNNIKNIINKKMQFNKNKKIIFLTYFKKNSFSMVSGFLLFQIYTPIVYFFYGSEYAGKVGLSIAIMTALFALSTSVIYAKLASITNMIADKNYKKAYHIYFKTSKFSLIIFIAFLLLGLYLLFYIDLFAIYQVRVVDINSFILLSLAWLLQLVVYVFVTFTRIFKRELFVFPTIVSSIYILITTIMILKYYSIDFIFLGLLSSYFFGLPWIYVIYRKFLKGKI